MNRRLVNMKQLEQDIEHLAPRLGAIDYAPPQVRKTPLPDYVEHQTGVGQLGAISAEAVVHQWEAAAKSVEAMGGELRKVVDRCVEIITSAEQAAKRVDEVAKAYRDQGAKIFSEIEGHALLVQDVTSTCETLQRKIAELASSA